MTAQARSRIDPARLEVWPLTAADQDDVAAFSCGDDDLDAFLRDDALRLQDHNVLRVYLANYAGDLVGYIALLADAVVLATGERKKLRLTSDDHPIVPALKVARPGVSVAARDRHQGIGEALMSFAVAVALDVAGRVGCRLLTVDAYPAAVGFYDQLGFQQNKATRRNPRPWPATMTLRLPGPR